MFLKDFKTILEKKLLSNGTTILHYVSLLKNFLHTHVILERRIKDFSKTNSIYSKVKNLLKSFYRSSRLSHQSLSSKIGAINPE